MLQINKILERKIENNFICHSILTHVFGVENNCLNEIVLLSTHNICFELINKKINF